MCDKGVSRTHINMRYSLKLNGFPVVMVVVVVVVLLSINFLSTVSADQRSLAEEEHGVIYANNCEACKILALELQERLSETGKSRDVIETG